MSANSAPKHGGLLLHYLVNVAVASFWLGYVVGGLELWRATDAPHHLILVLRNSALTLVFLGRRPATAISQSPKEWTIAIAGTFSGYLFGPGTPVATGITTALTVLAGLLMTFSILVLGRSFGIVPANRGIRTRGPYALVRHPIYSCYVLFDVGYLLGALSARNGLVFVATLLIVYLRAMYEERVLQLDPAYRDYAARVRYRFFPGIL